MATKNIEIQFNTDGINYDILYPKANWDNLINKPTIPSLPLSVLNGGTGVTSYQSLANNLNSYISAGVKCETGEFSPTSTGTLTILSSDLSSIYFAYFKGANSVGINYLSKTWKYFEAFWSADDFDTIGFAGTRETGGFNTWTDYCNIIAVDENSKVGFRILAANGQIGHFFTQIGTTIYYAFFGN